MNAVLNEGAPADENAPAVKKKLSREELEAVLTERFNALKRGDYTEVRKSIGQIVRMGAPRRP
jgi:hypothetical protein